MSASDNKLKLTKKEREQTEAGLIKFGETIRRAERKHAVHQNRPRLIYGAIREKARLERNAKQRATRRGRKVATYESDEDDEDEGSDAEGEDSDEQPSSDEEVDQHPRSSPIPPAPKRQRRILEEVTNEERPAHPPAKRATREPLQCASELYLFQNCILIFTLAFTLRFLAFRLFILGFFLVLDLGPTQSFYQSFKLLRIIPLIAQFASFGINCYRHIRPTGKRFVTVSAAKCAAAEPLLRMEPVLQAERADGSRLDSDAGGECCEGAGELEPRSASGKGMRRIGRRDLPGVTWR
ncbi:hypothetical protein B0H14DRAFT_2560331 [Mycena olivaceomarginata]|nr:hypothetical protein B0H14DRAFT_2560331 [Mycena olivaceomarginata]